MYSRETQGIAIGKETPLWSGCDVSKATFDAALWSPPEEGRVRRLRDIPVAQFERSPRGVKQFVEWADALTGDPGAPWRVVMEATGKYSIQLAEWMIARRPSLAPAIINPYTASRFIESFAPLNKTDRIDARALACYGREREPVPFVPPTPESAQLRELSRYRTTLVNTRTAERNRAEEASHSPLVRRMMRRRVKQLERDAKKVEEEMRAILRKTPSLAADARLLQSVYGIGFINATTILAELGDLRRFTRARQLTAFAGVSVREFQSGSSVRGRSRMSKHGSSHARRALYLAAITAIRTTSDLSGCYKRLVDAGKHKMAALGALMRKILVVMRAILISGRPYEKHYRKPVHKPALKC